MEIEIQVFAMHGDRIAERGETMDYYDIIVSYEPDEHGNIEVIEEHDNLPLEEADDLAQRLSQRYDTYVDWIGGDL
jgi:hypothetical protein